MRNHFIRKFIVYVTIVFVAHVLLYIYVASYGLANDISTEERISATRPAMFLINNVFGFPLSLFQHYDPINEVDFRPWLVLSFLLNCFIQFSILSFIWRLVPHKNRN